MFSFMPRACIARNTPRRVVPETRRGEWFGLMSSLMPRARIARNKTRRKFRVNIQFYAARLHSPKHAAVRKPG